MLPAGEPAPLRPLSLGEIFDRAVTLYVRNGVLFTLIALVVVLPVTIVNYFVTLHNSATFAQILDQIQHPAKTVAAGDAGAAMGMTLLMIALAIVLQAFVVVAIAAAVGELYRTGRAQFAGAFAQALRRAGAILGVLLCEIAAFAVLVFGAAFGMGLVMVLTVLLVRASAVAGIVGIVATAIVALIAFVLIVLCYLAFAFAFNALAVEGAGAGPAITRAFSRIFNRRELLRAAVICLALVAIYIGLTVVSVSIAALLESLKMHAIDVLVSAIISLVTTSFLGILLAVYYFDVRVRREGLDLQAQIADLQPTASV